MRQTGDSHLRRLGGRGQPKPLAALVAQVSIPYVLFCYSASFAVYLELGVARALWRHQQYVTTLLRLSHWVRPGRRSA